MRLSRRKFLRTASALPVAMMGSLEHLAAAVPKPAALNAPVPVKILATNWGFTGAWLEFAQKAKEAGYDGFEAWIPTDEAGRRDLRAAADRYGLSIGFLAGGGERDFAAHLASYEKAVRLATAERPLYVNTHAGRDFFSFAENKRILEKGLEIAAATGVKVLCETHRGRCAFSANATREYMEQLPGLRLTADLSHWCVVHESLLEGYEDTLALALRRTDHIHARIGHAEGPQVNDPRAPEWAQAVERHLGWWDKAIEHQIAAGVGQITLLTEFGPPHYLPALPYTRQPVANQWEINVHMMKILRARYAK
jgi:sugar phosphate isomerase/epimerase